jgi:hypothetical protein
MKRHIEVDLEHNKPTGKLQCYLLCGNYEGLTASKRFIPIYVFEWTASSRSKFMEHDPGIGAAIKNKSLHSKLYV